MLRGHSQRTRGGASIARWFRKAKSCGVGSFRERAGHPNFRSWNGKLVQLHRLRRGGRYLDPRRDSCGRRTDS